MLKNPKPLKKFGQNYLIDKNIINKIVAEINPQPKDNLLEIGPGRGAITEKLLEHCPNLSAVEIDTRVIENLKLKFPKLNIYNSDFLKTDLNDFASIKNKLRVVGNIPYNITSPIIFKLFHQRFLVHDSVLMVQNEVAKRMTAKHGSKDYGILSILLDYFTDTKYCFKISPNVFKPKPKVHSAIMHITMKEFDSNLDDIFFIKVVKAAFGNRRKTLKNSLSNSIFKNCNLSSSPLDLSKRAEQFLVKDFVELANYLKDH